jgi:hypothetical protein
MTEGVRCPFCPKICSSAYQMEKHFSNARKKSQLTQGLPGMTQTDEHDSDHKLAELLFDIKSGSKE